MSYLSDYTLGYAHSPFYPRMGLNNSHRGLFWRLTTSWTGSLKESNHVRTMTDVLYRSDATNNVKVSIHWMQPIQFTLNETAEGVTGRWAAKLDWSSAVRRRSLHRRTRRISNRLLPSSSPAAPSGVHQQHCSTLTQLIYALFLYRHTVVTSKALEIACNWPKVAK